MWREESGFLEMFLAYYGQFEENVLVGKAYRDFLREVLCFHEENFLSNSTAGGPRNQTQLEAAANALQFPWTEAFPVEQNPPDCSSDAEAAIQPKTEVLDDDCEFVCEIQGPSKAARLTSENEMETADGMKTEDEAASRMCDASWNFEPSSNSEQPPLIFAEDRVFDVRESYFRENKKLTGSSRFMAAPSEGKTARIVDVSVKDNVMLTDHRLDMAQDSLESADLVRKTLCSNNAMQQLSQCGFDILNNRLKNTESSSILEGYNHIRCNDGFYACRVCGKKFSQISGLKIHEHIHPNTSGFTCNVCGRTFSQASNLKIHERIHTGHRPHVCKFCGKSFSHPFSLTRHERLHTGERPFVCTICNKRFIQSSCLKLHERTHNDGH